MIKRNKPIEELKTEIEKIKKESAEYLSGWQRCQADFVNFKNNQMEWEKRVKREAKEAFLLQLINILDNFNLAIEHSPELSPEQKPWQEGIIHIERQMSDMAVSFGLEKIEVKKGDVFDPNIHECVLESETKGEEAEESKEKNETVEKVLRKGYTLEGKVLRPAQVTIS